MKKVLLSVALVCSHMSAVAATVISQEELLLAHGLEAKHLRSVSASRLGESAFVTVGKEAECQYQVGSETIQQAIDAAEDDIEIRIAVGTYEENIFINSKSITVKGGYSDCAQAEADNQDASLTGTIISPVSDSGLPTIRIGGDAERYTVNLNALRLINGDGSGFFPGGGISTLGADLLLILNEVLIDNNTGTQGGGIAILGGSTNVIAESLRLENNRAGEGGGLFCAGPQASFLQNDGYSDGGTASNTFNNNATNGDGGGVLLENGCTYFSYAGGLGTNWGLDSNTANGNGGGIAVRGGAAAHFRGHQLCLDGGGCIGNNEHPVSISNNIAGGSGGGVYVSEIGSEVFVYSGLISNNQAVSLGGAVMLTDEATFTTDNFFPNDSPFPFVFNNDCWNPDACNQISSNQAEQWGGALYVVLGSTANVSRTHITGNRADFGTAFYISGSSSRANVV